MAERFDPNQIVSQGEFGALIGITRPRVTQLMTEGALKRGGTLKEWTQAIIERAREQPHGRPQKAPKAIEPEDPDAPDLNKERALLTREQRHTVVMKRRIALGEYASIGVLADVLGSASSAVVAQFDQMESTLAKSCPGLDERAKQAVLAMLAKARNDWIRKTAELVEAEINDQASDEEVDD